MVLMQVRLVAPSSGKVVARYGLEAGEVVLAAVAVHLADSSASGRTRPLVAVGTSFSAGLALISVNHRHRVKN